MNPHTPMKLTDVGMRDIERYLTDDDWVMQQKLDGARVNAVVREYAPVLVTNDGVGEIKFAAARQALPALVLELDLLGRRLGWTHMRLDGELIPETGVLHVWDVLEAYDARMTRSDLVEPDSPLDWRLSLLSRVQKALIQHYDMPHLHVVWTAYREDEKRALWAEVQAAGVEGAVSKHVDSLYLPGTRTKEWVKHKLVKTADVEVVAARRTFKPDGVTVHTGSAVLRVAIEPDEDPKPYVNDRGRRSDGVGLPGVTMHIDQVLGTNTTDWRYAPRTHLVVGNASLIGKDLEIVEGSVVEVSYLLWSGEAMVQPRIMRKRDDKPASECNLAQFPKYSREVIA